MPSKLPDNFKSLVIQQWQAIRSTFYYSIHDFLPLIRAENGEIDIPKQEIRKGVVKALEILLDRIKSDDNNKLTEILSNTKSVLLQEENYN